MSTNAVRPDISSDDSIAHLLVGVRPGEPLECVGITLLAVLGTPQAYSGQNKGCAQMSIMLLRPINEPCQSGHSHLMPSDVEHENVSWTARCK